MSITDEKGLGRDQILQSTLRILGTQSRTSMAEYLASIFGTEKDK